MLLFYINKKMKRQHINKQMLKFINNRQLFNNKSVNKEKAEYYLFSIKFILVNDIKLFAIHKIT